MDKTKFIDEGEAGTLDRIIAMFDRKEKEKKAEKAGTPKKAKKALEQPGTQDAKDKENPVSQ